ncbi:lipocalin-like domain-containing protein [Serratia ureilytica]
MTVNAFIGSWALVSSAFENQDGELNYPLGEQVLGRIHYEANLARWRRSFLQRRAACFAADDLAQGSSGRSAGLHQYGFATSAAIRWKRAAGWCIRSKAVRSPNWVGSRQVRFYAFSGDRLTLRCPCSSAMAAQVGELVWQRTGASL